MSCLTDKADCSRIALPLIGNISAYRTPRRFMIMTRRMARIFVCLICSIIIAVAAGSALAAEISGVKLPDQVTLGGKSLKLNGAGLRQATILKLDAYAAGLYLENAGHDGDAIANSARPKAMEIVLLGAVSTD